MTPDDFASALNDRLRRRGILALPEDVRSFTADIGHRFTAEKDLDHWADLFVQARSPSNLTVAEPRAWTALGAFFGLLCSPVVMVVLGGLWGAIARPAPCYCGGGPDMITGAFFGVVLFVIFLGIPTAIVSTVVGAITGARYGKRRR